MMKYVSVLTLVAALMIAPVLIYGNNKDNSGKWNISYKADNKIIAKESALVYDSLRLEDLGLNEKAFQYAWKGYVSLRNAGKLKNTDIISICDFSQSSNNKRLYIIDVAEMRVLKNTYVAHGRGSGTEFARYFSNRPESHKSSLGFYVTGNTYTGQHGLSLKINGIERGINDKALARRIVVHGCDYVGDSFLSDNPFTGRSFGCPAVPKTETEEIIEMIKDGTCMFIYHPSKLYITKSKILNA
jgi:hypothetical protein